MLLCINNHGRLGAGLLSSQALSHRAHPGSGVDLSSHHHDTEFLPDIYPALARHRPVRQRFPVRQCPETGAHRAALESGGTRVHDRLWHLAVVHVLRPPFPERLAIIGSGAAHRRRRDPVSDRHAHGVSATKCRQ
ncbi:hypothetical protein D3C81_1764490 [compost metagenome]